MEIQNIHMHMCILVNINIAMKTTVDYLTKERYKYIFVKR